MIDKGFLTFLTEIHAATTIQSVTVYTLARPSHQPEAIDLHVMPLDVMADLADDIRLLGFHVVVTQ
jgi:hypothetical protein